VIAGRSADKLLEVAGLDPTDVQERLEQAAAPGPVVRKGGRRAGERT